MVSGGLNCSPLHNKAASNHHIFTWVSISFLTRQIYSLHTILQSKTNSLSLIPHPQSEPPAQKPCKANRARKYQEIRQSGLLRWNFCPSCIVSRRPEASITVSIDKPSADTRTTCHKLPKGYVGHVWRGPSRSIWGHTSSYVRENIGERRRPEEAARGPRVKVRKGKCELHFFLPSRDSIFHPLAPVRDPYAQTSHGKFTLFPRAFPLRVSRRPPPSTRSNFHIGSLLSCQFVRFES